MPLAKSAVWERVESSLALISSSRAKAGLKTDIKRAEETYDLKIRLAKVEIEAEILTALKNRLLEDLGLADL